MERKALEYENKETMERLHKAKPEFSNLKTLSLIGKGGTGVVRFFF